MARLDASDRHGESSALAERRVDGYTAILRFLHGLNASVQRVADCVDELRAVWLEPCTI